MDCHMKVSCRRVEESHIDFGGWEGVFIYELRIIWSLGER